MELLRAIRSYISSCLSFEPGPSCRVSKSSDTVVLVKNAGASSATSTYNPSYIFRIINDHLFDVFEHYDGEFLKVRSLSESLTDARNKYVFSIRACFLFSWLHRCGSITRTSSRTTKSRNKNA